MHSRRKDAKINAKEWKTMKKLFPFLLLLALLAACAAPAAETTPDISTPETSDISTLEVSPEPTPHPTPTLHPVEETPAPTGEPSPAPEPSAETARPLAELPELTEGELTQEEIAGFNALFAWGSEEYDIAAAQLFANHYADITEMNLDDALYYYPDDGCLGPDDTAEKDALRGHVEDLDWLMSIVPCHRILRSSVDETLRRFAGVTTAEMKTMENALYVPEFDAFYNFSSDYGPGYFTCEGGRVEGDTATLWGKSGSSISFQESGEGVRDVVTLKREDGAWHIKAHVKQAVDPSASLEAFLLSLTGEDIAKISGGGAMEKDAMAELIHAGCQNMLWDLWGEPREVLGTLTLTLTDGTAVSLEALDHLNIVRASGPELPHSPAYLCHPGLYELVKTNGQIVNNS